MTQLPRSKSPVTDGMACINPHQGEVEILISRRTDMLAISKLLTFSESSEVHGRDLCKLRTLVHEY
jgi:hypothetical protein